VTGAATGAVTEVVPRYVFPASYAQERMWFLEQSQPGTAYHMPAAVRVRGRLDLGLFDRAVADLVRRHETLRTCFEADAGRPVQVVLGAAGVGVVVVDLRGRGEPERDLPDLVRAEAARPFDLRRAPLLRVAVFRLADDDQVILFTAHHIVADGWSMGVLVREVAYAYAELVAGHEPRLPEPAVQYADYTVWQRETLAGDALERQVTHWRRRLDGIPDPVDLPTDWPRPRRPSYRGARHRGHLPADLVARLRAIGEREGATLFMTLYAGFAALMRRCTGEADTVVGTPIANRHRHELEGLIGFLANTLVLRLPVDETVSFRELVRRSRDVCLDAYDHQDLPFDLLVERLRPRRDLARHPVFQVMVVLQNAPLAWPALAGLRITPYELPSETAKFDLLLELTEAEDGVSVEIEYATDLYTAAGAAAFAGHLEALLRAAADEPDGVVGALSLDPAHVSVEPPVPVPGPEVLDLAAAVREQARVRPDGPAVCWPAGHLSYRELVDRADALAGRLAQVGVGPGDVVAVELASGPDYPVALLAVLIAGAGLLGLDPAAPEAYRRRLAGLAKARAVITAAGVTAAVPVGVPARPSTGDAIGDDLYDCRYIDAVATDVLTPADLAGQVARLRQAFALAADDGVLGWGRPGRAASGWEVCWPLALGGRVVLTGPTTVDGQRDDDPDGNGDRAVRSVLAAQAVAVLHTTPDRLACLVAGPEAPAGTPRLVLCGGQALPSTLADDVAHALDTTLATVHPVPGPGGDLLIDVCRPGWPGADVPVGRPVTPGARLRVVDDQARPVPDGTWGHLDTGATMSTVDDDTRERVRRRHDGRYELAGPDGIRVLWLDGQRMSAARVEAALLADPGIVDAVVTGRRGPAGRPEWIARIVPDPSGVIDTARLRADLARRLPAVSVPAEILVVDPFGEPGRDETPGRAVVLDVAVAMSTPVAGLVDTVDRALAALHLPCRPRTVHHGQILREWGSPVGAFATGVAGVDLLVLRTADLAGMAGDGDSAGDGDAGPGATAFARRLDRARASLVRVLAADPQPAGSRRPAVVAFVADDPEPGDPEPGDPGRRACLAAAYQFLRAELGGLAHVRVVDATAEPVDGVALGLRLAVAVLALADLRPAAVAVDTALLWRDAGDGMGSVVDEECRAVRRFLVELRRAGIDLLLVGAGDERDLGQVFRAHRGEPLRLGDVRDWAVGWGGPGRQLRALLARTRLDADDVVYLGRGPAGVALVRAELPDLVALAAPRSSAPSEASPLSRLPIFTTEGATR
jgi:non-ribosomal peptide synthetase component F